MKTSILSLALLAGSVLAQSSSSGSSPSSSAAAASSSSQPSGSSSGPIAKTSPTWLADVKPLAGNVQSYPTGQIPTGPFTASNITLSGYPTGWKSPPTDSPQVQAAYNAINWSLVPTSAVRKANADGTPNMSGYGADDPDCWWSATGCTTPKHSNVEPDIVNCPTVGDWGLTYDDGPLTSEAGQWAEPNLYDFLAQHNNQKAALFYIGSNVIQAPAAAQRALADGHTICVHTWSHPAMTTQTNQQVVAELYWALHAIKEVTGVTPKCWRPPYGDVDDRVRAIANQMGMTTVIWDEDTNDWNMPGSGGGNLPPSTVDGYFEGWIEARKNGTDNQHGHIVLEHELNNATVSMAEKWLPQIQQTFRVVPFNQCMNISQPYWETNFVYPTDANPNATVPSSSPSPAASTGSSGASASAAGASSSSSKTSSASSLSVSNLIIGSVMVIATALMA
ncbi:uncharacterized protein BX664DRAFT_385962 [Halteromyces radiatus]|uniref:uncharacterized protein n=1 Tax=Halteromyces radiatus TaxID=101107 RepID=UPI00221F18D5|nr:uncharacterized protein BX664DRAFT_385962 [Halteromyces radiatus]KAI8089481.1 hypothetical protein BX664DRAFT_385962 [Halteromyces radiatus]